MKRAGEAPAGNGAKKPRDDDGGPEHSQFEEDLMMMETFGDEGIMDVVADGIIDEAQEKRWARPFDGDFRSEDNDLQMHWVDIDMTSGVPLESNPCKGEKVVGSREAIVPVVRMYGSTRQGHSVVAYVHGVTPYFYVGLPQSANLDQNSLGQLRLVLDQKVCDFDNILPFAIAVFVRCPTLTRPLPFHPFLCVLLLIM